MAVMAGRSLYISETRKGLLLPDGPTDDDYGVFVQGLTLKELQYVSEHLANRFTDLNAWLVQLDGKQERKCLMVERMTPDGMYKFLKQLGFVWKGQ